MGSDIDIGYIRSDTKAVYTHSKSGSVNTMLLLHFPNFWLIFYKLAHFLEFPDIGQITTKKKHQKLRRLFGRYFPDTLFIGILFTGTCTSSTTLYN